MSRMTRQGFPAANTSSGISLVTTLPAPITVREPMRTPGRMNAPPPTHTSEPIWIGSDVWVGGGAFILPGVRIGSRTVIGAGSVVTKDIPDDVFAAGNPCRVIRDISQENRPAG